MAVTKLLNLFAVTSVAILACSYGATPVNALTVDTHHLARSPNHAHAVLAKKKRSSNGKRCKPRPVSSTVVKPTTTPAPPPPKPTSTKAPVPTTTKPSGGNPPPPPPPPSNGGGNSGYGKVGIAWPQDDDKALANVKTSKVSPIYTWSPWVPTAAKKLGFEGVPMFWGEKQAADFKRIVVKGYAKYALGFNEPNQQGQSDMSPQRGAQLWKQYLEPLAGQGYTLISPATTNAPSGKKWMQDFFGQCGGCTVSIVAVHWYGTKADEMIAYLKDIHATFGRPIWVTEYACQDFGGGPQANSGQVWAFHQQVKKFMDDTEWIKAYFAFGFMHNMGNVNPLNQLLGSNGKPTDLGYLYIN